MKRELILGSLLALALVAGVLVGIQPARAGATITVSALVADDGLCSPRQAIIAANTDSASAAACRTSGRP